MEHRLTATLATEIKGSGELKLILMPAEDLALLLVAFELYAEFEARIPAYSLCGERCNSEELAV